MKVAPRNRSWLFSIGLLIYLALIFVFSHVPGRVWSNLNFNIWDKAVHFIEYVPVGVFLAAWLLSESIDRAFRLRPIMLLFALITVAAAGDELHQYFIPGREATMGDVIADILGGGVGAMCTVLFLRWRRLRKKKV